MIPQLFGSKQSRLVLVKHTREKALFLIANQVWGWAGKAVRSGHLSTNQNARHQEPRWKMTVWPRNPPNPLKLRGQAASGVHLYAQAGGRRDRLSPDGR